MFDSITVDRSLFFITQQQVDDFKELALKLEPYYSLELEGAIFDADVWVTAFNIWLLSQPDEMLVLESVEKTFYYSSNFIVYDHLKNDYHFNYIRTHEERTEELNFLLSIHITNELNKYWEKLLREHDLADIIEKNRGRSYFDAHHQEGPIMESFVNDQARFVKVLVSDIKSNNTFSRIVKECCNRAFNTFHCIQKKEISSI